MTMQDDKPKNTSIDCNNCGKYLGIYTGFENSLFRDDFYCNLKCDEEHQTKKRKNKELLTEKTLSK